MTIIEKDSVVTIKYTIHDLSGELLDQNEEGLTYLHGGYGGIFPLVEEALHRKGIGERLDILLESQDAFGVQDKNLILIKSENDLDISEIEVGKVVEIEEPETGNAQLFRVIEIEGERVILDGNHPFAGLGIKFQCEVISIRKATSEEIDVGHADENFNQ